MMWDLPVAVLIDGKKYDIRNKCDYRVVLDCICALNDTQLDMRNRLECALYIFYEDLTDCKDYEAAVKEMYKIIGYGESDEPNDTQTGSPPIMSWEYDFKILAPPISRVLGYDIRTPEKYTHWWTVVGAYYEIGDCVFAQIVNIRNKRFKGKKLEKWEEEFYLENRKKVDLPLSLSDEEQEWLNLIV